MSASGHAADVRARRELGSAIGQQQKCGHVRVTLRVAPELLSGRGQMTIQDLGSMGEFVAAIATVATIIYLAVQIRQNSKAVRAQVRQSIAEQQFSGLMSWASDPILRDAILAAREGKALTAEQDQSIFSLNYANLRMWENFHTQMLLGNMSGEEWDNQKSAMRPSVNMLGLRSTWSQIEDHFNERFWIEVAEILRSVEVEQADAVE